MNVLRKFMAKEAAALKPLLDAAYGAIVRYQRDRSESNDAKLRSAFAPAVKQLMVFRPYMPLYKQAAFDVLEDSWKTLATGDLIMLFDHCVDIMHLRLSRDLSPAEEQQPWSRDLLEILEQRRRAPHVAAAVGDFACSGVAAAGGRASGPARVIRDAADLEQLRAGEVVVCAMSTTDWVVALGRVAAIVTDQGGLACHAAIIAREMGLPCVTGCGNATAVIATGDVVEVDGDLGLVTRPGA